MHPLLLFLLQAAGAKQEEKFDLQSDGRLHFYQNGESKWNTISPVHCIQSDRCSVPSNQIQAAPSSSIGSNFSHLTLEIAEDYPPIIETFDLNFETNELSVQFKEPFNARLTLKPNNQEMSLINQ